jgi:protein-tyrosine phosphatase
LKNIKNFRDFGGYLTVDGKHLKKGFLFRSGDLDKMKDHDIREIKSLGIKTIIDVRSLKEHKRDFTELEKIHLINLPFNYDNVTRELLKPLFYKKNVETKIIEIINSVYHDMMDQLLPKLGELFRILLSPGSYPILIHCHAGKDRTGFACAVIHLALEIQINSIVKDYLKSNEFLLPKARRITNILKYVSLGLLPTDNLIEIFTSREKYIRTIIDGINNEYGGVEKYLLSCRITPQNIRDLREFLLEDNIQNKHEI